jgi:KDO2-lipid IV(A) lauroyltransferase
MAARETVAERGGRSRSPEATIQIPVSGGPVSRSTRKILYSVESVLLPVAEQLIRPLPFTVQRAVGRGLGRLVWVASPRRRLAIENVRLGLGVERAEARRIARASHLHLGRALVEILTVRSFLEPGRSQHLELIDLGHLQNALAKGRGALIVTAHIGNWELAAIRQAQAGIPLKALGRVPTSPHFTKRLKAIRTATGNDWLPPNRTLLHAAKELRRGGCVAMAIDQFTRSDPKLKVDFLGRPTTVSAAVYELSVRFRTPVVPCVCYPRPDGGYDVVYHPAEEPIASGSRGEQVRELALRCLALVENWIRNAPDTWFWFHNMWKDPASRAGRH